MTIEPLSSVMSVQAQNSAPKNTSSETAQVDGSAGQVAEAVDVTTKPIENVQNKADSNNGAEQKEATDSEQLKKAVEKLNKKMENSEAIYGIHEGTNRVTIKIVDKDTKEVIKELPPEKTLDMIAKAWEMAGILVDEKR